jgi:6-pyruvoyltetrahydropterin/6-carboxytetrahydropterin synthase
MFELKILTHFSAAHQLQMVGEKCENLHGHNWRVEVCVSGERLDDAGVLVDFGVIKKSVAKVMATLDHKFLNDLPEFSNHYRPSSENIAVYIARQLQEQLIVPGVSVSRVSAWESDDACASYIPQD